MVDRKITTKNYLLSFIITGLIFLSAFLLGIVMDRVFIEHVDQFTDESRIQIENEIADTFKFWLPFVEIKRLIVDMDEDYDVGRNKLKIDITFNINKDPNTLASVRIDIGD